MSDTRHTDDVERRNPLDGKCFDCGDDGDCDVCGPLNERDRTIMQIAEIRMTPKDHEQYVERRIAEIEAREQAATKGPWHARPRLNDYNRDDSDPQDVGIAYTDKPDKDELGCVGECFGKLRVGDGPEVARNNGTFIAHARTDVPWLIAQLRAAREDNARLREALKFYTRLQVHGEQARSALAASAATEES